MDDDDMDYDDFRQYEETMYMEDGQDGQRYA